MVKAIPHIMKVKVEMDCLHQKIVASGDDNMQIDDNKTLHTITRYDGLKTVVFVIFCLAMSMFMLGGTLVMWLLN